jgi:hypothetical protein
MKSNSVQMSVTQIGAQMAPVQFNLSENRRVQPYHVSPWQCEEHASVDGRSEGPLRGDFFCLPFGQANPEDGLPSHGRTASAQWSLSDYKSRDRVEELELRLDNALRSASVSRRFYLIENETVVYDRTAISGLKGRATFGHHAVLRLPSQASALLISTSRQALGMTYPTAFADTAIGEHQSLAIGGSFRDLASVPSFCGDAAGVDCSVYPSRRGHTDLLQIGVETTDGQPAWCAAVNSVEGYLWFSLRDPALLPSTILWFENAGRTQPPWNGRNCSLGVEDVCSYFDKGSFVSAQANAFSERGIKTVHDFGDGEVFDIPYIQGIAATPPGFGHVCSVGFIDGGATFSDQEGREVFSALRSQFVFGEEL